MGWPRPPPTPSDFYSKCPGGGASAGTIEWIVEMYMVGTDANSKWPKVDHLDHPTVYAQGFLTDIHISPLDWPVYHDSHDLDMKMFPELTYSWLKMAHLGDLTLETESGQFPHFARPAIGDHVSVAGRWIFDCGHDPKTEIHPTPLFESDRIVLRPLYSGGKLQPVRLVRIWLNSSPGAFEYTFKPPYNFVFEMPSVLGAKIPFLRVVQALNWNPAASSPSSSDAVSAKLVGKEVHVGITPPTLKGAYYYELMLGYLAPPVVSPDPYKAKEVSIYTVTLKKIDIIRAESGSWYLDVHVNGEWHKIFPAAFPPWVGDGYSHPLAIAMPVAETQLKIGVTGYYVTPYDLGEGDSEKPPYGFRGVWNLGKLADLAKGGEHTISTRNWILYYTVTKEGDVPSILPEYSYWAPRLLHEPSVDTILPIPSAGSSFTMAFSAYITEVPLEHDDIRILDRDVDVYSFRLDDFGNVHIPPDSLPAGVDLIIRGSYPDLIGLPRDLQEMLGYIRYQVTVQSKSGSVGDLPYALSVQLTWRDLPPDWGVDHDKIEIIVDARRGGYSGGREVDLYNPDPKAEANPPPERPINIVGGDSRLLDKAWAWQHVRGEIHYYDVWLPNTVSRPEGQPVCEYDEDENGRLEISAEGMHLSVLETKEKANDRLTLRDLNTRYPSGHVHVKVTNPTGHRGVYQFRAEWYNGTYYTPKGCKERREFFKEISTLTIPVPWPVFIRWGPSDPPWWKDGNIFPGGGFVFFPGVPKQEIDIVISTPGDKPVIARLYDSENVLVAESTPIDQETLQLTPIAPGVSSHRRLIAKGLNEGDTYALHLVPEFDVSNVEGQSSRVGISQFR